MVHITVQKGKSLHKNGPITRSNNLKSNTLKTFTPTDDIIV